MDFRKGGEKMPLVKLRLQEEIATFVKTMALKEGVEESTVLEELIERGFEQKLMELYKRYQEGEISLGYLAEQLGIGTWRAYHLLEERGLRTANI
jgi:predicted HTH domain antitoxin